MKNLLKSHALVL